MQIEFITASKFCFTDQLGLNKIMIHFFLSLLVFDRQNEAAHRQSRGAGTDETVCPAKHEPRAFLNVRRYIIVVMIHAFATYFERGN